MKTMYEIHRQINIAVYKGEKKHVLELFHSVMKNILALEKLFKKQQYSYEDVQQLINRFEYLVRSMISNDPYKLGIEVFDNSDIIFIKPTYPLSFDTLSAIELSFPSFFNNALVSEHLSMDFQEVYEDIFGILYTPIDETDLKVTTNFVFNVFITIQSHFTYHVQEILTDFYEVFLITDRKMPLSPNWYGR